MNGQIMPTCQKYVFALLITFIFQPVVADENELSSEVETEWVSESEIAGSEGYAEYLEIQEKMMELRGLLQRPEVDPILMSQYIDHDSDDLPELYRLIGGQSNNCKIWVDYVDKRRVERKIGDCGYPQGRSFHDFNGDQKADYVSIVGGGPGKVSWVKVWFATDTGFESEGKILQPSIDSGYENLRSWLDVNSDGGIDYVRSVGSHNLDQIEVTYFDKNGKFLRTRRTKMPY